ncbi:MAG: TA system VapC family ribonuclease toxin [Bryobacteraceae bacterium]
MIAVDTNLLVYAHRQDSEWHEEALAALKELAEGVDQWATPWPCVHEFLAIVTHPRIFVSPTPLAVALQAVRAWLESPFCRLSTEGPGYIEVLQKIAPPAKVRGPEIDDARVADICLARGVREWWTADRDFSWFRELKSSNPLLLSWKG